MCFRNIISHDGSSGDASGPSAPRWTMVVNKSLQGFDCDRVPILQPSILPRTFLTHAWAIALKPFAQHLLDVLNHLLRIAKLIEIVDEFPFATRGDQIGESRVIN